MTKQFLNLEPKLRLIKCLYREAEQSSLYNLHKPIVLKEYNK